MHPRRKAAFLLRLAALAALGLSVRPAAAQSALFNFDTDSLGMSGHAANTLAPFTDSSAGITVTFTGSTPSGVNDPGGYFVYGNDSNPRFSGNVLVANHSLDTLAASFDQTLQSATFLFSPSASGDLTVQALRGGTLVSTSSSTGSSGQFTYTGGPFDTLVLSDTDNYLTIDNLAVTAAPEPSSAAALAVGGLGLLALVLKARKRRPIV